MGSSTEIIYTWESDLKKPRKFLRDSFSELKRSLELGYRLFFRDVRAQYRETLLGLVWVWVPALTICATFLLAQKADLIAVENTGIPYAAYLIISSVLWQVFAEAVATPVRAINGAKGLLSKVRFPAESILVARLLDIFVSFLVKMPLIIAVMIWFRIPVQWTVVAFPAGVLALIALGYFLGMCLVPIGGLYQDVGKAMPLLITFWMFLTPVFYPGEVSGLLGTITKYNPVTPLLVTTRAFLTSMPIDQLEPFLWISALSLVGVFVSWLIVRLSIPILVERAGN